MTYTREQVLAMEPGRELDKLVAVHVTKYQSLTTHLNADGTFGYLPNYSTDIAAVWEVEEEINKIGEADDYGFELYLLTGACEKSAGRENLNVFKLAHASPAQRCKAALLAVLDL